MTIKHRVLRRGVCAILATTTLGIAFVSACSSSDDTSASGGSGGSAGSGAAAGKGGANGTAGSTGGTTTAGSSAGGTMGTSGAGGTSSVAGNAGEAGMVGEGGAAGATPTSIQQNVTMTLLTSDQAGAANTDANLVNGWGLAINPNAAGGPLFWVSSGGKGVSVVLDPTGAPQALVVTIPPTTAGGTGEPSGQVYNASAADFKGDVFIFATEDGLICGWQAGTSAVTRVNHADTGGYKGLALVTNGATPSLVAANFHAGTVDVFDTSYAAAVDTTLFTDPNLPAGFAPFNVAELGGKVYVTYAKQDAEKGDDVKGVGNGYVDVFGVDGTLGSRLISQGSLNSPWGLALAPDAWGALSNALLVGNFGDGLIHAYDASTGEPLGELTASAGAPIAIDGLWALSFGPNSPSANLSAQLFFTSGPAMETHGQFGKLTIAP